MSFRSFTCALVLLAATVAAGGAWPVLAQDEGRGSNPPPSRDFPRNEDRGSRNSMSDSVRRVRNETGGQVLSVERMQYDGRDVTRVKYIDDRGRVRTREEMDSSRNRRGADAPVRPRREIPDPQPARGDNPPRP